MAHLKGMETLLSKKLAVSDQAVGTDTATPGAPGCTGARRAARGSQRWHFPKPILSRLWALETVQGTVCTWPLPAKLMCNFLDLVVPTACPEDAVLY